MKVVLIFIVISAAVLAGFFWVNQEDDCYGYRGVTITHRLISSAVIDKFKITVYLPRGYSEDDPRRYPVVYILDGGYFGKTTAILMSHLYCTQEISTEAIVVGIGYYYDSWTDKRYRDFIYTANVSSENLSINAYVGGGMIFYDFIKNELIPYIDTHYKTDNTVYGRTLIGHSLGGYFTLLAFFRQLVDRYKPEEAFSNFISASPVIVNGWEFFFPVEEFLKKHLQGPLPLRIYMGGSSIDELTRIKFFPILVYRLERWNFPGFYFKHQTLKDALILQTSTPIFTEGLKFTFNR